MRTTSLALALAGVLGLGGGCGAQPATRAVTGQLRVDTSTMNHPVVIAQSSDHRVFVADVTAGGRFTLQLPPEVSYRVTLASTTRTAGVYSAAARINWPLASGASRWATLGGGAALDLGAVHQRGSSSHGGAPATSGGDSGGCREDDGAGCQSHGSDIDCDCDHQMGAGDACDKDDDSGEHEQQCNDDDHHKCAGDGGESGDDGEGGHGGSHACDGGTATGGGGSGGGGGGGGAGGIN